MNSFLNTNRKESLRNYCMNILQDWNILDLRCPHLFNKRDNDSTKAQ